MNNSIAAILVGILTSAILSPTLLAHTGEQKTLVEEKATWRFNVDGSRDKYKKKLKRLAVIPVKPQLFGKSGNPHYEFHFETQFEVEDLGEIKNLTLKALYNDQCIVYLNGKEIVNTTTSTDVVAKLDYRFFKNISSEGLIKGKNKLTAKVINRTKNAPVLVWDALLFSGINHPMVPKDEKITRGPYLQNTTPNSIVIRWRTDKPQPSKVSYKKSGEDIAEVDEVKLDALTTEHSVTINGLEAHTEYQYQVIGADVEYNSKLHSFKTLPVKGLNTPVKIWITGDSGTANTDAKNVYKSFEKFSNKSRTDVWLMLGDNAYQWGMDSEYQGAVFDMYEPLLHSTSLWSTLGNHETYWHKYDADSDDNESNSPYFSIFDLPSKGEAGGQPSGTEHYYSFDYGRVHFICLDSQSSSRAKGGAMYQWLEKDLVAIDKEKTDWTIAFFHHPPYTHGTHNSDKEIEHIEMRENIVPLLEKYHIDFVFGGHSHTYERSILMSGHYGFSESYDEKTHAIDIKSGDPKAGGAYEKKDKGSIYSVAGSSGKVGRFRAPHLPFMKKNISDFASVIIEVEGKKIKITALGDKENVLDYYEVKKN